MTTMFNILKRPDQTLIQNAKIEITLIAGTGAAPGYIGATSETILSVYTTLTDVNGRWEVALTPNVDITPANTYYHVVERVTPNNRSTSYYIIVPDAGATPGDQWVGNHRINTPVGIDQILYSDAAPAQTGAEIKALYEVEASAFTDAQFTKLSNIEAAADVTDATNVAAAGAAMVSVYDPAGHASQLVTETDTQTLTNKVVNDFSNEVHSDNTHLQVRNESGGILAAGTPVYASGYSVGQERILVSAADASSSATMPSIGVLPLALANNATGEAIQHGTVMDIDTSTWDAGDLLYVSETLGELTSTRPATGAAIVQEVGHVSRKHADFGILEVNLTASHLTGYSSLLGDATTADEARTTLGAINGHNGTYTPLTHAASGTLTLDFSTTDVGFVVSVGDDITDVLITNGPAAGDIDHRTLIFNATATVTIAYGSLDVVDAGAPTAMNNLDSEALFLVVTSVSSFLKS